MMHGRVLAAGALAVLTLAACEPDVANVTGPRGSEALDRYVAMGTSISMGVQSDGVLYSTQARAWPALLSDQAFAGFSYPAIRGPGCKPPVIAPLQFSFRLNGRRVTDAAINDTTCAPLFTGITLPANNVAIAGATTQEALSVAPANLTAGSARHKLFTRVLPAAQTQVTAMMAQHPTLVSVELGANEVLGAVTRGVLLPGITYVLPEAWMPVYTEIVDSVEETGARALLVTVPRVGSIVSLRTGAEIWANRTPLLAGFNVEVNADCDGNTNLIFVPGLVLGKIAEGAALAPQGQRAQLSCTDQPPPAQDFILTPANVTAINGVVDAMNAHISQLADARGFALLDANAVLGQIVAERPAFAVTTLLSCTFPFGQYISLDGVHPNGYGHQLIANAAALALNERYGFAIPTLAVPPITPLC